MPTAANPALYVSSCLLLLLLSASTPAATVESYEVDGSHSFVLFRVQHLGVGYAYGRFNEISGSFRIDEENPGASSVSFEIQAGSVDTASEERDKHLRSPDFFNAKQFPTITFTSESVKKKGDSLYEVSGEMSLHGVTRPLTVQVERVGSGQDPWGKFRTGFETTFTVKRTEFGMSYMVGGIGDEVRITLSVEGVRQ